MEKYRSQTINCLLVALLVSLSSNSLSAGTFEKYQGSTSSTPTALPLQHYPYSPTPTDLPLQPYP